MENNLQVLQATNLDAVLPCRGDDLPGVKLQGSHWVIVLQRLKDAASAKVPDLHDISTGCDLVGVSNVPVLTCPSCPLLHGARRIADK